VKANYLNQAFNPAQARAIEKYVEGILAAGAKPVEVPAPVVVAEKKPTRVKPSLSEETSSSSPVAAPVVAAKPETTEE
jgi:hypothetical protein